MDMFKETPCRHLSGMATVLSVLPWMGEWSAKSPQVDGSGRDGRSKHLFCFLTRTWVREDPCIRPNSAGLSKTPLCQALHVTLNLLSSTCSPSTLRGSSAHKFAGGHPEQAQSCPPCATVAMDLLSHHREEKAGVPSQDVCRSGPWQVILGKRRWSENKILPSVSHTYWKTWRSIRYLPTYLPCSYALVQASALLPHQPHSLGRSPSVDPICGVPAETGKEAIPRISC